MNLPELQDHLIDVLNSRDWSLPFTAELAYNPQVAYECNGGLRVFVLAREYSSEVNDETAWSTTLGADIAIAARLPPTAMKKGTENVDDVRPYLQLCAEITSFFKSSGYEPPEGFRIDAVGNAPAYDPDALNNGRFISPIQIDLFAAIEE
ncbi:MAG TPA: hypothetical protein VNQ76_09275 [Planctomicrobium sp.]|nr:hypothetical protein [Planctomicrobium sp.]